MKDFNFFEGYYKTRKNGRLKADLLVAAGVLILFAAFSVLIINYTFNRQINALRLEIEANNLYLASRGTIEKISQREALGTQLSDLLLYNSELALLSDKIKSDSIKKTELLLGISEKTPADTSINTLSVSSAGILDISGVSAKETSVAEFRHNLKELDVIKSVHIEKITKISETEYGFTMNAGIKDVVTEYVRDE